MLNWSYCFTKYIFQKLLFVLCETLSKLLTSLENKGYTDKTIKPLQKPDGQFISNQENILNEVQNFYKRLFSHKKMNLNRT